MPWPDEAACAESAARVARSVALADAFLELHGPLGAGKTTFVRHLLRALGVEGRIKSPTYALMESYRAATSHAFTISHFDFYRFDDASEWEDAGFREVFAEPGLKLVEWPEKAAELLPRCDLRITIAPRDDGPGSEADAADASDAPDASDGVRDVRFEALSAAGSALLSMLSTGRASPA